VPSAIVNGTARLVAFYCPAGRAWVIEMRLSIRMKVFSVALGLIALVAAASYVSNSLARAVNRQLHEVANGYLPAYAAAAGAHVGMIEEEQHLDQYLLLRLEAAGEPERLDALLEEHAASGRQANAALGELRRLTDQRIAAPGPFDDLIALGRVDAQLAALAEERTALEALHVRVLAAAAAAAADGAALRAELPALDASEERTDRHFERLQQAMLALVERAAAGAEARERDVILSTAIGLGLIALIGLSLTGLIAQSLIRPVRRLLEGTRAVEAGRLDTTVPITSRDEIGRLTEAFNHMTGELRLKSRIKDTFGKYVDPRIVAQLLDQPDRVRAAGEKRVMTILFCDMKGFTSLAEGLTPDGLVRLINEYLTLLSEPVRAEDGIIDKYLGDGIMAYWGPPFVAAERQGALAAAAALGQLKALDAFRARLPEVMGLRRGLPAIDVRIGLASGEVVVGTIGSDVAKSYTVMGDPVNLAARLESANKIYGTRILLNAEAARLAAERGYILREVDSIQVAGKTEPERIFELIGEAGAGEASAALREAYGEALEAYRAGRFAAAVAGFEAALALAPADGPSLALLERARQLALAPAPGAWDGVYRADRK
jgi:adenylate cyclase